MVRLLASSPLAARSRPGTATTCGSIVPDPGVAAARLRVAEVALGPRRLTSRPRPAVAALVPQILDALFTCLRLQEKVWTAGPREDALQRAARPADPPDAAAAVDVAGYAALFREGLSALGGMLEPVFRPPTLAGLRAAAATDGA
jgi:hypothetical protein